MFQSKYYFGKVEDVKDPDQAGKVRVRVFGVHSSNPSEVPTSALPWAPTVLPTTSPSIQGFGRSATGLVKGSIVLVVFLDGDEGLQEPFVLSTVSSITEGTNDNPYGSLGSCDPYSEEINAFNTPESFEAGEMTSEMAESVADPDSPNYKKRPEIQRWLDPFAPAMESRYKLPQKMLYAINWIEASGKSDAPRNRFTAEGAFQQKDIFWQEFQTGGRFQNAGLKGYDRHNGKQAAQATASFISSISKIYGWTDERILVVVYNQGEGAVQSAIKKGKSTGVDWLYYINEEGKSYWKKYKAYIDEWGRDVANVKEPDATAPITQSNTVKWMDVAQQELGTSELSSGSNPRIEEYHRVGGGLSASDDVPWCASFVNYCLTKSGFRKSGNKSYGPAGALSFSDYGVLVTPRFGAIVLIKTGTATGFSASGYHVGFFYKDNGNTISVLGGNQGNMVKLSNFKKENVVRYCWPSEADTSYDEKQAELGSKGPIPTDCNRENSNPSEKYPNNHVTKSVSGHLQEVDDTPGDERIHMMHRSGSNIEYLPNGNVSSKTVGDRTDSIIGNQFKSVEGSEYKSVQGDKQSIIKGSVLSSASSNQNIRAGGVITLESGTTQTTGEFITPELVTSVITVGGSTWNIVPKYSEELRSWVLAIESN